MLNMTFAFNYELDKGEGNELGTGQFSVVRRARRKRVRRVGAACRQGAPRARAAPARGAPPRAGYVACVVVCTCALCCERPVGAAGPTVMRRTARSWR